MGIWDQLNTETIADNAGTEIQVQSNPVHLQESNREQLQDIHLINRATLRDGSPIPGTGQVKQTLITDGTTGHQDVFFPEKGEVWLISTISVKPTATGTINLSMSLEDSTSGARAVLDTGTGNVTSSVLIDMVNGPVYVSKECFLQSYVGTNSGGVTFDIACHRVR